MSWLLLRCRCRQDVRKGDEWWESEETMREVVVATKPLAMHCSQWKAATRRGDSMSRGWLVTPSSDRSHREIANLICWAFYKSDANNTITTAFPVSSCPHIMQLPKASFRKATTGICQLICIITSFESISPLLSVECGLLVIITLRRQRKLRN